VNIAFKLVLTAPFGVVGLALATAIGAWVNLGLLLIVARRRRWSAPDAFLGKVIAATLAGCILLAAFVLLAQAPIANIASALPAGLAAEARLAMLAIGGGALYGLVLLAMLRLLGVPLWRSRRAA